MDSWEALERIYGSTWKKKWGDEYADDEGNPTEKFQDFAIATENLTPDNWRHGLRRVKDKINADVGANKEPWPFDTGAIFYAMCFPIALTEKQKSATGGQSAQSFKRHPNLEAKDNELKQIAVDPGYTERKKEAGNSALKDMMESL